MNFTATAALPRGRALLPFVLRFDAVVSGANGAAYLLGAGALDSLLGLDAKLLRAIGAFLLLYAAFVWWVGGRPTARTVWPVIEANTAWALTSLVLVAGDWLTPTTGGAVWIVLQALVVGGFAALQYRGLRQAG